VNGQIVGPPATMKPNGPGTVLKVTGSPTALNLRSGPNRIRVIRDTNHSNIYILNR
jgi:hypothetical protein